VLILDRAERHRRHRGYRQRHSEALNYHRGEERDPVRAVVSTRQGEKQKTRGDCEGSYNERQLRPEAGRDVPGEAADQECHRHKGQEHAACDEGRVSVNLHHEERQEEK
jgi:hypothetical protein